MTCDSLAHALSHGVQRLGDGYLRQYAVAADHCPPDPVTSVQRLHGVISLHARQAEVNRGFWIAADRNRASALYSGEKATADATKAAGSFPPDWSRLVAALPISGATGKLGRKLYPRRGREKCQASEKIPPAYAAHAVLRQLT
jgi:hypothetical protein